MSSHNLNSSHADYDIVRKMRASNLVLGPLLARTGEAVVSLPGGCAIGARPMDLHIGALEALGATIELKEGYLHAKSNGRLKAGTFEMRMASVGATENFIMRLRCIIASKCKIQYLYLRYFSRSTECQSTGFSGLQGFITARWNS